jgi:DNA-binding CsgD family transcriptional regulator
MGQSDHDPRRPRVPLAVNPAASSLTDRQREVARLVADGLKDILIVQRLGLSPATVHTPTSSASGGGSSSTAEPRSPRG